LFIRCIKERAILRVVVVKSDPHGMDVHVLAFVFYYSLQYYRFPFNCPFLHKSEIFYTPYVKNLRFM